MALAISFDGMSGINERANKRFGIRTDDERKRTEQERDAIRLVLAKTANPRTPLIPAVDSAHMPQRCDECGERYWGPQTSSYCAVCEKTVRKDMQLQKEIGRLEVQVRRETVEMAWAKLLELKKKGAPAEKILKEISEFSI